MLSDVSPEVLKAIASFFSIGSFGKMVVVDLNLSAVLKECDEQVWRRMLKARFPTASAVLDGLSIVVDYSVFKHQARLHTSLVSPPQASDTGTVLSIQDTLGGIQATRNLTRVHFFS